VPAVVTVRPKTSPERLSDPKARIVALDALRGFALCGILIVDIWQTLRMRELPYAIGFLFHSRFFVIFSLLFGIGFGLFLDSAKSRSDRPRLLPRPASRRAGRLRHAARAPAAR